MPRAVRSVLKLVLVVLWTIQEVRPKKRWNLSYSSIRIGFNLILPILRYPF